MCLLAIFYRVVSDAPLVVGANREEFYARGGEPPRILDGPCRAVAGVDPVAGGTWLGVSEKGVLIAVTNRSQSRTPSEPRSRGLLVRELLSSASARLAQERAAAELKTGRYQGCNLLCADGERLVVLQWDDVLHVHLLPSGFHVLANREVDEDADPRVRHALTWLAQRPCSTATDCSAALKALCSQTGEKGQPPICFRGPERGTVSSTIVALAPVLVDSVYWHAQGPPDRTPYVDYSPLLRRLSSTQA